MVIKDGKPWFVAKDVAEALGYKATAYAVSTHCKGVCVSQIPSKMGKQKSFLNVTFID